MDLLDKQAQMDLIGQANLLMINHKFLSHIIMIVIYVGAAA